MNPKEYELPESLRPDLKRALRLEWWTIGWMLSIIVVIGVTSGGSQAMKAAWIEDCLSLVPPIAVLIASRVRHRAPNRKYQWGYHRSVAVAFLCASAALLFLGSVILYDSIMTLVRREHPTIGSLQLFGHHVWLGWVMIAALLYSIVPPVILGHKKLPLAKKLHDKAIHTDADMNKADWLTGLAGILGICGIAVGWWWADSIAAGFISFEIVRDGVKNMKRVVEDLMDTAPTTVEGDPDDSPRRLRSAILDQSWVEDVEVRVREAGHVLLAEAYVVAKSCDPERLASLHDVAKGVDWRYNEVIVTPVSDLGELRQVLRTEPK